MANIQFTENDIVLYPTDTIYGLGVDATNAEMLRKLKELKGRPEDKHTSIAVSGVEMLRKYAEVTPLAERLIKAFLPGKLTIVLNAQFDFPREVVGDDGSVGVRIPALELTLELIQEFGKPITATSANVAGMPTESAPQKILEQFGEKASLITQVIDEGELPPSEPSTVVDARGKEPIIIREGAVSKGEILTVG